MIQIWWISNSPDRVFNLKKTRARHAIMQRRDF